MSANTSISRRLSGSRGRARYTCAYPFVFVSVGDCWGCCSNWWYHYTRAWRLGQVAHLCSTSRWASPNEDPAGRVRHAPLAGGSDPETFSSDDLEMRKLIEDQIMVSFAGEAAEEILTEQNNWQGAIDDREWAVRFVVDAVGSREELGAYINWLWIRTRNSLLSPSHWKFVEAVAKALLERGHLTRKEVRSIINDTIIGM